MDNSEPVPVDFANAFDDWIGGASVSSRSVAIYGKPGLYAEYQKLERELAIAESTAKGEASIGDGAVDDVLGRMEALYEEWMASKSTWIVQAISEDKIGEIRDTVPFPDEPPAVADDADDAVVKAEHAKARAVFEKQFAKAQSESNMLILAAAVTRIEFAGGAVADGVTVDQLQSMKKALGSRQMLTLIQTATLASIEEPEIPSPFSRRSSKIDQT